MPAPGGSAQGGLLRGGACSEGRVSAPRGVCLVETPPTATAADGTHPSGMHSCFK